MFNWLKNKQISVPTKEDVLGITEFDRSPDSAILEDKQAVLLFMFDEFKMGWPCHDLIEKDALFLGVVYTQNLYQMILINQKDKTFPVILENPNAPEFCAWREDEPQFCTGKIQGHLFLVRPRVITDVLDKRLGNKVQSSRQRIRVLHIHDNEYTNQGTHFIEKNKVHINRAYAYVGNSDYWDTSLSDLDYSAARIRVSDNKYYRRYFRF